MRNVVCCVALFALICARPAAAQSAADTASIHVATTLREARVGFYAVDLRPGKVLANVDADGAFLPASTMKLLAGSVALDRLGPAFTFTTRLWANAAHLYVQGGGDPTFDDAALRSAAGAVASAHLQHVDAISIDNTRYNGPHYPPGWSIDDRPYDYAAPVTAFSLDDNVMHFTFAPGATAGASPALLGPSDAATLLTKNALTTGVPGSDDTSDLREPWDLPGLEAFGSIPAGGPTVALDASVLHPVAFAYERLRTALELNGVKVDGSSPNDDPVPANADLLWTHASPPFAQVLARCWLPSNNFYAEMFVNELGAQSPGGGTTLARGIATEQQWLATIGIDPHTLTIVDGSGLSEYDRVTPRALVAILTHDWNGANRAHVLDALPLAGVRGTLQYAFTGTPLQNVLYAKTGSMNHTRTLAGYLLASGHEIAFALMINDWVDPSKDAASALDRARASMLESLLATP